MQESNNDTPIVDEGLGEVATENPNTLQGFFNKWIRPNQNRLMKRMAERHPDKLAKLIFREKLTPIRKKLTEFDAAVISLQEQAKAKGHTTNLKKIRRNLRKRLKLNTQK